MPKIAFIHPDLGIGGAERLIVDAAVALKGKGHNVIIFTSHHDTGHCFDETKNGAIPVQVYGDWIPRSIFGYCHAIFAYIRMLYVAICLLINRQFSPDVIICDQVSAPIPILKWKCSKVVFYCHFPDQLLSTRGTWLKTLYRAPINYVEEVTTKQASKIFVNSKFTSSIFLETFKSCEIAPDVLYPTLPTDIFDKTPILSMSTILQTSIPDKSVVFLSLNRYERKKNVRLAIKAFDHLQSILQPEEWNSCHLIVAGGYDENLLENIQHFAELESLILNLDIKGKVTMLKSPKDVVKISLLKNSTCLLYTPSNEHFGIVPIEAMYMETPVIGVNSGGPTETIVEGQTGFLREPTPNDFADAMVKFVKDPTLSTTFGKAGRRHVIKNFSFDEFSRKLDLAVQDLL